MSGLNVTVDNVETLKLIEDKLKVLNSPEPLLKNIGRFSRALTFQMFKGKRPDTGGNVRGETWNPLKIETIKEKRNLRAKGEAIEADRPLVRTGKLRDSLLADSSIKVQGKGMEYGTNVHSKKGFPYPGIHQIGDDKIPKRRFLFWTDTDLQQILKMCLDFIEKKMATFSSYVKK